MPGRRNAAAPVHLGGRAVAVVVVQLDRQAELGAERRQDPDFAPGDAQLVNAAAGCWFDAQFVDRRITSQMARGSPTAVLLAAP